ncbi:MAG: hypothetical protein JXM70_01470 [Pirellulales bacterium]|nr:hypothetical protein [Pirellulales bacterium]
MNDQLENMADALRDIARSNSECFISSDARNSEGQAQNVVDALAYIGNGLFSIANAIGRLADVLKNDKRES